MRQPFGRSFGGFGGGFNFEPAPSVADAPRPNQAGATAKTTAAPPTAYMSAKTTSTPGVFAISVAMATPVGFSIIATIMTLSFAVAR